MRLGVGESPLTGLAKTLEQGPPSLKGPLGHRASNQRSTEPWPVKVFSEAFLVYLAPMAEGQKMKLAG